MGEKIIKVTVFCVFTILTVLCKSINGRHKIKEQEMRIENVSYTTRVENCMEESQVEAAVVDEYREGGYMSTDENFKCYLQCMCYGTEHCDKNGVMIKSNIPHEIFNRIKDCVKILGDNKCDTTYKQMSCMSEKA